MNKDTLSIQTVTDSTVKSNSFVEKTITIEKSGKIKTDYFSKTLDFVSSIAWPITIIFIILLLKKQIINLLNIIGDKIKESKSFSFGKGGLTVEIDTIKSYIDTTTATTTTTTTLPPEGMKTIIENDAFNSVLHDTLAKRILSTLWKHQNEHDKSYKIRWTFILGKENKIFPRFIEAANKLQELSLIDYYPENGQFYLTNFGISFCSEFKETIGNFSFFDNPLEMSN